MELKDHLSIDSNAENAPHSQEAEPEPIISYTSASSCCTLPETRIELQREPHQELSVTSEFSVTQSSVVISVELLFSRGTIDVGDKVIAQYHNAGC
jgi:hypothetical protein